MDKWEIKCRVVNITRGTVIVDYSATNLFNKNDNGIVPFDVLQAEGKEGWELISVTPIVASTTLQTKELLFTFKRKIE